MPPGHGEGSKATQFQAGQSGNPERRWGQPEGNEPDPMTLDKQKAGNAAQRASQALARNLYAQVEQDAEAIATALVTAAKNSDVAAIRELFDRTLGKVAQKIELTNVDVFAAIGQAMAEQGFSEAQYDAVTARAMAILDPHADAPAG